MNIAMTTVDIWKWIAYGPVKVSTIHGYNPNAFTVYILLLEVPPLADGSPPLASVPIYKSLQCLANAPYFFSLDCTLSECFLVLSSTEASFTALAPTTGMDLTLVGSSDYQIQGNETVVGDLTTNVTNLVVWSEALGAANVGRRLLRTDVANLDATATIGYYIVAKNLAAAPAIDTVNLWDGSTRILGLLYPPNIGLASNAQVVAKNTTDTRFWGPDGLPAQSKDPDGTTRLGCIITLGAAPPGNHAIRAIRRTP